jgi:glycosyltransferase involved in cell wall biosynthesis
VEDPLWVAGRMNVLYLTMNPNRASTTVPTEGWLRALPSRGLRPVLVSRECGGFQAWASSQGIPAYQNDLPFPDKYRPLAFAKALWNLRHVVRRHRIDLVHCNEQDIYPIGAWVARVCRIPVVVSVHFTMNRAFCQWAFGGRQRPDRIFFVSAGNLNECRAAVEGVVPEERWRVLPNGLDLTYYQPDEERRCRFREQHGVAAEEIAVGVACAIRPRKQLEHLFEVMGRLHDLPVRVFVAGTSVAGDEEYAAAMMTEARRRLDTRLVALGFLDDLRDMLNGLDIVVNTSREEACSISVLESLACGCPVLGYPSKSVDEQILPDGGEIVPQDDVDQLAIALRRWTDDATGLHERRRRARWQAERSYDIRRLADQLWNEYQTLRNR